MFEPVGGDPDSLLRLAGALDAAAAELRRLQVRAAWGAGAARVPSEAAALAARVQVWLASEAPDLRRRARILAEERRFSPTPDRRNDFPNRQRAKALRLTREAAQVTRLKAVIADPAATAAAKGEARRQLRTLAEETGERLSRLSKDIRLPPTSPRVTGKAKAPAGTRAATAVLAPVDGAIAAEKERQKALTLATVVAAATWLWWPGRVVSPVCGPAAPLCALAL
ncbi:MAG TPA: hypothetical protein VFJ85_09835 [Acidimicrobiales bacterium]|nr:hypothetical protein [Acidimicrobiales bacterium]